VRHPLLCSVPSAPVTPFYEVRQVQGMLSDSRCFAIEEAVVEELKGPRCRRGG